MAADCKLAPRGTRRYTAGAFPLVRSTDAPVSSFYWTFFADKVVFMTMFFGNLGNNTWVSRFLDRALVVGLPRLIFASPDPDYLHDCCWDAVTISVWAGC